MPRTALDVANEGLVRLGVPPLGSFSDATAQGVVAEKVYQTVAESEMAAHPWVFAYREHELFPLVSTTRRTDFEFAFQLPQNTLRVLGLRSFGRFGVAGDQIHADESPADVVLIERVDEAGWPSWFAEVVALQFAAAVAISLTDTTSRAELLSGEAQRARQQARSVNAMQVPPFVFDLMRVYLRQSFNPIGVA